MASILWGLVAVSAVALCLIWPALIRARRAAREADFARAMKQFHQRREYLEAKFLDLASHSGKPRGLVWEECDFEDGVAYVRDRATGELSALVAVTIRFSAVPGGDMEDVEAVGNLRSATAVFVYGGDGWATRGRGAFNLNPTEAIDYFQEKLEMIARETAAS